MEIDAPLWSDPNMYRARVGVQKRYKEPGHGLPAAELQTEGGVQRRLTAAAFAWK